MADADPPARTLREWFAGSPLPRPMHLLLGLVGPMTVAIFAMSRLASFTVDDSYISYRYAKNLARGWGLVYNQGERIEGYTNFLWTVLLAGALELGIDPNVAAKILGGACGCAAIALTWVLSQRMRPFTVVPCLATWLLATTTVFVGYSVFGLETPMFIALVLAGMVMMLREEERCARMPWSGLVFGAAGLTRPEAPLYLGLWMLFLGGPPLLRLRLLSRDEDDERPITLLGGLFVILCLLAAYARAKEIPKPLLYGGAAFLAVVAAAVISQLPRAILSLRNLVRGALFVAPVGAHLLWRHSYYGSWLPNTLTAKTGNLQQQLLGGADYVEKFVLHDGPVMYLAVFGVGAAIVWKQRELLACSAIVMVGTAYVVLVGGDWMVLFRFIAPLLPFVFLLIGVALRGLFEQRSRVLNAGLLLFGLVCFGQRFYRLDRDRKVTVAKEQGFWENAAGGTVEWFRQRAEQVGGEQARGEIALGDIGQIGYQTDYPVLDLLGLVDPVIATLPGGYTNKIGEGYRNRFFDKQPRYFILISAENDCHHPSVPGSRALYYDPRFKREFYLAGRVKLDAGFSWCVWERQALDPGAGLLEVDPRKKKR